MSSASDEIVIGNKDGLYTYDNPAEIEQNDLIVLGNPCKECKPCMWVTVIVGYPGRLFFTSCGLSFWTESIQDRNNLNNPYCRVFCASKRETVAVDFKNADMVFLSGSRPATPAGFYLENDISKGRLVSYFDGKGHYRYYDPNTRSLSEYAFNERSTPPEVADKKIVPLKVDFTEEDTE